MYLFAQSAQGGSEQHQHDLPDPAASAQDYRCQPQSGDFSGGEGSRENGDEVLGKRQRSAVHVLQLAVNGGIAFLFTGTGGGGMAVCVCVCARACGLSPGQASFDHQF